MDTKKPQAFAHNGHLRRIARITTYIYILYLDSNRLELVRHNRENKPTKRKRVHVNTSKFGDNVFRYYGLKTWLFFAQI